MVVGFSARSITRSGLATAPPAPRPHTLPTDTGYRAGACNIGPAEIARRRRSGHVGLIATMVLLVVLALIHAPAPARLLVFVPAAVSAAGYLQAWLRFCAAFGWLGVFNFGDVGTTEGVDGAAARARDRQKAVAIGLASGIVGLIAAVLAVIIPV